MECVEIDLTCYRKALERCSQYRQDTEEFDECLCKEWLECVEEEGCFDELFFSDREVDPKIEEEVEECEKECWERCRGDIKCWERCVDWDCVG